MAKSTLTKEQIKDFLQDFLADYKPRPKTFEEWRAFFSDWINYMAEEKWDWKIDGKKVTKEELITTIQSEVNGILGIKGET